MKKKQQIITLQYCNKFSDEIFGMKLKYLTKNRGFNTVLQRENKNNTFDLWYFFGKMFLVIMVFEIFVYQLTFITLKLEEDKTIEYAFGWKPKGVYSSNIFSIIYCFLA